jgi:hypothetical protein
MKITLEVFYYAIAGLYGFLYSYFVLKTLQKYFFQSVKKGKFNPIGSIFFMFVSAIFLFIPALIHFRYFIATFFVAVITNLVLLVRLSKSFTEESKKKDQEE